MEMIERYIYAVTQKLPQSQRADIAKELRSLIQDMLDERVDNREVNNKDVEEVLQNLGSPKQLAQKYRGSKKYLIGPEFYDSFILILKITLISVAAGMSIVFAIQIILDPIAILDHFVNYIVSLVTVIPQAIGWVTFSFVFFEHFAGVKAQDLILDNYWKPADLPPIPDPKRSIKRSEPIVGIVFYVFVIMLFTFSSEYFGIFLFQDDEFSKVIPFLNEETFSTYLLFIILILGLSILKESLKLISGKWTLKLFLYTTLVNVIAFVTVFIMISGSAFWNPNFMQELTQAGIVSQGSEGYETVRTIWDNSTQWILIFLVIGLIWDSVNGFIKIRKK